VRSAITSSGSGHPGRQISGDRFLRFTGWEPQTLEGRRVLDVGRGAGRFAEVALAMGARVVAVDTQSASTLRSWNEEAGLEDISVERVGFLVARGRRPAAADP
jgi:2-polyprenyl-3-methyl-5-hydroxy-6-metoxy-1,4-benzoquinol methylase